MVVGVGVATTSQESSCLHQYRHSLATSLFEHPWLGIPFTEDSRWDWRHSNVRATTQLILGTILVKR